MGSSSSSQPPFSWPCLPRQKRARQRRILMGLCLMFHLRFSLMCSLTVLMDHNGMKALFQHARKMMKIGRVEKEKRKREEKTRNKKGKEREETKTMPNLC